MTITDPKLIQMLERKEISKERTISNYEMTFKQVEECLGKTPSELLEIARKEEEPFVQKQGDNYVAKLLPLDDRSINQWQFKLKKYWLNNGLKKSTINIRMMGFRTFFREYNITMPKPIKIKTKEKILLEGDIPEIEHIRKVVNYIPNIRNKFIVSIVSVTGLRGVDIRNLKMKDIVKGCGFDSIHQFMTADLTDVLCELFLQPQKTEDEGNPCLTFITPECLELGRDYLKTRKDLNMESYLLTPNRVEKQLSTNAWLKIFRRIDESLFNGDGWFHAHALRAFFINIVNDHTVDDEIRSLLSGHKPALGIISRSYLKLNTKGAKEVYYDMIPDLTIQETKVRTVSSKEAKQLDAQEKRIAELEALLKNFKKNEVKEI